MKLEFQPTKVENMDQLIVLINLGSPENPDPRSVGRYLKEFLMDPMVIDRPWWLRTLLVKGLIVPFRRARTAQAYASIWTEQGSPLVDFTRRLAEKLSDFLGPGFVVDWAMRYGSPRLADQFKRWSQPSWKKVIFVPLYPHKTKSSTGTVQDLIQKNQHLFSSPVEVVKPFYRNKGYIQALVTQIKNHGSFSSGEHLLFSFHSLPERHLREVYKFCLKKTDCCEPLQEVNSQCYRSQCLATARSVAEALQLQPTEWSVGFQSRLGREPWVGPTTSSQMEALVQRGVQHLYVVSPSFVVDCLETLEEIGLRGKQEFENKGGKLTLLPALNLSPAWVSALADLIKSGAGGHDECF